MESFVIESVNVIEEAKAFKVIATANKYLEHVNGS